MDEYLAFISGKYPNWVELIIINNNEQSVAFCIDKEHLYTIPLGAKFQHLKALMQNNYAGWGRISFTNKKFHATLMNNIKEGMLIRASTDTTHPYTYVESITTNEDGSRILHCQAEGEALDIDAKYFDKYKMTILLENLDKTEFDNVGWVAKKAG